MPPDTPAPRPDPGSSQSEGTSADIAEKIQQKLDTEPLLSSSNLKVAVDDHSVTLTGTVNSQQEREVALSMLALYAGKREIVDRTRLRS
jgi:osmotically-inducible protein OsmY